MRDYNWCGLVKFKDRPEFLIGVVQSDTELGAERKLKELLSSLIPLNEQPEYVAPIKGSMYFREDTAD